MQNNDPTPWFSEEAGFFGPGYLLEYEETIPAERTLQEVAVLEKLLALQAGTKILDMPCGRGRHAVELAKRGYNVTGVDLNNFFLEKAKEAAAKESVALNLQQGDMRQTSFDSKFDVVLNLFTAIGYFEHDADDQKVFENISRSLKRGGLFLIDFINHDRTMRNFRRRDWRQLPDGSMLLIKRKHDIVSGKNIELRITIPKGDHPQKIIELICRMYTPIELIKMGAAAGLRFKEAYGDFEGGELSIDSKRVLLVFEKP
jgi:2-polyprenyl-3-methyl-5-hydroxy-6-metoxy-1,4-benzoquinol methylase